MLSCHALAALNKCALWWRCRLPAGPWCLILYYIIISSLVKSLLFKFRALSSGASSQSDVMIEDHWKYCRCKTWTRFPIPSEYLLVQAIGFDAPVEIRQAAAVMFKNYIKKSWVSITFVFFCLLVLMTSWSLSMRKFYIFTHTALQSWHCRDNGSFQTLFQAHQTFISGRAPTERKKIQLLSWLCDSTCFSQTTQCSLKYYIGSVQGIHYWAQLNFVPK